MRHWIADGLPGSPERPAILLAVDHHDNGWQEVDAAPIVEAASGRILDFTRAPADVRRSVWPRGVERLASTPYAAALVAQHALYVYARFRSDDDWKTFFEEMTAARDAHLRAATGSSLEQLQRDYAFVRLGDLASLVFCNAWQEPQTEAGYSVRLDGSRVVVAPDPFGGLSVPIEISGCELPDRPFSSAAEAQRAMAAAPRRGLTGTVCGAASA